MSFNPAIPQPGDLLSDSQGDLLQNMISLDASFGIDHYTFSDLTIDNGKHRNVTTPAQISIPTTLTDSKLFGYKPNATIPVIQFSVAQSPPLPAPPYVPSPVTYLQSPAAGINFSVINTTTNVFDFTGISRAIGKLYAYNFQAPTFNVDYTIYWTSTGPVMTIVSVGTAPAGMVAQQSGNILQLRSTGNNVLFTQLRWTFQLLRIEV